MSYLMQKFKGIYRLHTEYDRSTNTFPREIDGTLGENDIYIECANGTKVFHYGKDILEAYIPSLIRGHNILKTLKTMPSIDIYNIEETQSEILFRFKYKDSDKIIPLLKPKTSGAKTSPFSTKNLPKSKYIIPDEDLAIYKKIIEIVAKDKLLTLSHLTNSYLKTEFKKKVVYEKMKADMALKGLKGKEYIHSIGKWDKFINYLEKNIVEAIK